MNQTPKKKCCDHGGKRMGCSRKPGIKTQPIRLPHWLLEQLNNQGDAKQLIIEACITHFNFSANKKTSNND